MMTSDSLCADAERARQIVALIEVAGKDYTVWHGAQVQAVMAQGYALLAAIQGADAVRPTSDGIHIVTALFNRLSESGTSPQPGDSNDLHRVVRRA